MNLRERFFANLRIFIPKDNFKLEQLLLLVIFIFNDVVQIQSVEGILMVI